MQQRFNTLTQWLTWQESLHGVEIDLGLGRIQSVFPRLNLEAIASNVITVAGTNGKGSTVAVLESLYKAAGYRVGAFTSPHLLRYNERIKVQGKPVSDEALCAAFAAIDHARGDISLTYFEFNTLAAFYIFAQYQLDIALLEVGLGGRLDATNIIQPDVSIVTSIGIDHQQWLGNTREEIAREKAGIFRAGKPAICADPSALDVLSVCAENIAAPLFVANREYRYQVFDDHWCWQGLNMQYQALPLLPLAGQHQYQNTAAALTAVELLSDRLPVALTHIELALPSLNVPGRLEIIRHNPMVMLDVAHNADAVQRLCEYLSQLALKQLSVVFGLLNDKPLQSIVTLLSPYVGHWYVATLDSKRSFSALELANCIQQLNDQADCTQCRDIESAYDQAITNIPSNGAILVTGSFLSVCKILALAQQCRL